MFPKVPDSIEEVWETNENAESDASTKLNDAYKVVTKPVQVVVELTDSSVQYIGDGISKNFADVIRKSSNNWSVVVILMHFKKSN